MSGDIGVDHKPIELISHVEDVVIDPELPSDTSCVFDISHRTATLIGRTAPQPEGDTCHLMALLLEHQSGDRGVHPS